MPGISEVYQQARGAFQANDMQRAEQLCRELLRQEPGHFQSWQVLGDVLAGLGQHREAAEAFRQVVRLRPESVEGHFGLGIALGALQRRPEAMEAFRQVLRLKGDHAEALTNLGITLAGMGRIEEALVQMRQAVQVRPDFAPAHNNLGVALAQHGKPEEAMACFEKSLQLKPDYAEACYNLGNVLGTLGRRGDAIAKYRRVLELKPDHGGAWNNLGLALTESGHAAEAVVVLQQAVRLRPKAEETHLNLGLAYAELGRFAEAAASYQEALQLNPSYVEGHMNLGNTYKEQGRTEEALACFQTALWLDPNSVSTHYNRSLTLLQAGEYVQGWPEYEWRWRRKTQKGQTFPRPRWDGGSIEGKTVLLWCEQGLGDAIQFVRFASLVKARGARVVLECPGFMIPLFSTCPGVDQLVAEGESLPSFDVQVPLMSLPGYFGTTLENVPGQEPYLQAEPARVGSWRQRLEEIPGFKVGIVWQGNQHFQWDKWRSIPLEQFAPVAAIAGVRLISLQKGFGTEQLQQVKDRFPVEVLGHNLDAEGGAFLDTAAIMKNLDLVITADTSAAHLAGALGVPVWIALSKIADWRWLLGRDTTPWYPTMRLFRQTILGDWQGAFARLAQELQKVVNSKKDPVITLPSSPGELLDKLTILEIKTERITDPAKLMHVRHELNLLRQVQNLQLLSSEEVINLVSELKRINESLWEAEDELRECEQQSDFGDRFVKIARSIYRLNDQRGRLKRKINDSLGSGIHEQKEYVIYE